MPGLVPGIHAVTLLVSFRIPTPLLHEPVPYSLTCVPPRGVDGRDKPGHDGTCVFQLKISLW
jgi:hypothetical protein